MEQFVESWNECQIYFDDQSELTAGSPWWRCKRGIQELWIDGEKSIEEVRK